MLLYLRKPSSISVIIRVHLDLANAGRCSKQGTNKDFKKHLKKWTIKLSLGLFDWG
jgi:hypothetical protein